MEIYRKLLELSRQGRKTALGIVVKAQGSTPQKAGSKAIVDDTGALYGTLGGGLVEAESISRMRSALEGGRADLFDFRLDDTYSREAGPICGGVMRLFANPLAQRNAAAYEAALAALEARHRGALVSVLADHDGGAGSVEWVQEAALNGQVRWPDAASLRSVIAGEQPALLATDEREVFVEPVVAPPRLLVVGGGHVGQEIVRQAVRLDFEVTVIDDRAEFARPNLFPPGVRAQHGDVRRLVGAFPQDGETFIVLVSKGHRPDAEALEGCIHGNAAYIGMIGSKRKIRFLRKHFIEDGLATEAEFNRIIAPIGFDIGAITVPEIGVSIAAQLIAARRAGRVTAGAMHEALQRA